VFLAFLLSFAQRLACDYGRFGEAILIGIDDQPLTALRSHLMGVASKNSNSNAPADFLLRR
jgi:hypothetical protein